MMSREHRAFSALELTIVLVMVGLILAALAPQLQGGLQKKRQQSKFYAQLLELHVQRYREDHQGRPPSELSDLTRVTDASGRLLEADAGESTAPVEGPTFGPYLDELPLEPVSGSRGVLVGHRSGTTGWRYWPETGDVEAAYESTSTTPATDP